MVNEIRNEQVDFSDQDLNTTDSPIHVGMTLSGLSDGVVTATGGVLGSDTENTGFNRSFEIAYDDIKMNSTPSVGLLDTIARADHIHVSDFSFVGVADDESLASDYKLLTRELTVNKELGVDTAHITNNDNGTSRSSNVAAWQSFTATSDILCSGIAVFSNVGGQTLSFVKLYEGEGTDGRTLLTVKNVSLSISPGFNDILFPTRIPMKSGQKYTWSIGRAGGLNWNIRRSNAYAGGTNESGDDYAFKVYEDAGTDIFKVNNADSVVTMRSATNSDMTITPSATDIDFDVGTAIDEIRYNILQRTVGFGIYPSSGSTPIFYVDAVTNNNIGINNKTPNASYIMDIIGAVRSSTRLEANAEFVLNSSTPMTSVSTGAANNDKMVTQGYVDDAVSGENIWDRVTGTPNYVIPNTAADDVGATAARITKGWFTNLEVTNYPSVNGTALSDQYLATTNSPQFAGGTYTGNVTLNDNVWLYLGNDNDGQIRFNGTNVVIYSQTGNLNLRNTGTGNVNVESTTADVNLIGTNVSIDGDVTHVDAALTVKKQGTGRSSISVIGNGANNARVQTTYGTDVNAYMQIEQSTVTTQLNFGSSIQAFVINANGDKVDTRIEGDTDQNLLFADAETDTVCIGGNVTTEKFNVVGNTSANSLITRKSSESINDDAEVTIAAGTTGYGSISVDESDGICYFRWESDNTVHLDLAVGGIFVNTDTDAKFCIYNNTTNVALKNRLGAAKTCRFVLNYS